jgi:hypothetical protein
MLRKNVGGIDRLLRIVVGLALIAAFVAYPGASWRWLLLVGIVPLATGLMSSCPLYTLFGWSTCPRSSA